MAKERVYIVLSHINSLKRGVKDQWEVTEKVEFLNQLKSKHYTMSSAIVDYLERKIIKGSSIGITDYQEFENYIRSKYGPQMKQLDKAYRPEDLSVDTTDSPEVLVNAAGAITV
jgi:hypothetical protein